MEKNKIIDKWFTRECKNKCDPKNHMKVVGIEDIEELKKLLFKEDGKTK